MTYTLLDQTQNYCLRICHIFIWPLCRINIYSFSFREYLDYYEITSDFKSHFYRYLEDGGMPSTFDYSGDDKRLILMDLYNSIVLKDVIQE